MEKINLTLKQHRLYLEIDKYIAERGISPSIEEMMGMTGAKSTYSIWRLLDGMQERGWIRRTLGKSRSIILL
jgi:SOS-response transcriptional repressor LexA